ncbi:unnamed protein product, partial [Mesorhabditis spiculigera]
MYCHGPTCKYCVPRDASLPNQAILSLYSDWVTPEILAMSRPLRAHFEEHELIENFQREGICAVFNLEEPGEHAHCGPGILASGFTYDPEWFMKNKISYFNYPLPDFEACTTNTILDIVQVATYQLSLGKIAIHCHAGHGRTGMVAAAILVYRDGQRPANAVRSVRQIRAQSVQSHPQIALLNAMGAQITGHTLLPIAAKGYDGVEEVLEMQRKVLEPRQIRCYSHLPKMVSVTALELLNRFYEQSRFGIAVSTSGSSFEFRLGERKAVRIDENSMMALIVGLLDRKSFKSFSDWLIDAERNGMDLRNIEHRIKELNIGQLLCLLDSHMKGYDQIMSEAELSKLLKTDGTTYNEEVRTHNVNQLLCLFLLNLFSYILPLYHPELALLTCYWCTW